MVLRQFSNSIFHLVLPMAGFYPLECGEKKGGLG